MLIHANISAPCTLLDFPTLERFTEELRRADYDIIGISSILPNIDKVKTMCRLIRAHQPRASIVVGGHISSLSDLDQRVDADYIVRGEGVRWFREFLGEDSAQPIRHPRISSAVRSRTMGFELPNRGRECAATLISSVGCPVGCNFCPAVVAKLSRLLDEIKREVGLRARVIAPLAGRFALWKLRREDRRLRAGYTYEPPTFYEINAPMRRLQPPGVPATLIRWVSASEAAV